ncbi:hypothetical protein [Nannocystis pusilla]|uniref:hypothetical protein n=1 Tax=Nannocystis pusilla TaxID=889268 RepID=UPI003B825569
MLAEVGSSGAGNNGGRLNLVGFEAFRWHASGADEFTAMFDDLQAEGSTFLIQEPGTSSDRAEVVFVNLGERRSFGTVAHYITRGPSRRSCGTGPSEATGSRRRSSLASSPHRSRARRPPTKSWRVCAPAVSASSRRRRSSDGSAPTRCFFCPPDGSSPRLLGTAHVSRDMFSGAADRAC